MIIGLKLVLASYVKAFVAAFCVWAWMKNYDRLVRVYKEDSKKVTSSFTNETVKKIVAIIYTAYITAFTPLIEFISTVVPVIFLGFMELGKLV